jgi:hypothetical protein
MSFWDFITGTKRPAPGVLPKSPAEVKAALLAVHNPQVAFTVRDGAGEGADVIAEMRIKAKLRDFLGWGGIKKSLKVSLRIDRERQIVWARDRSSSSEWSVGLTGIWWTWSQGSGWTWEFFSRRAYGLNDKGELVRVNQYRFASSDLKAPLRDAVLAAGWVWRPAIF